MTYHPTRDQIADRPLLRRGKDVEKEGAVAVDGRTAAGVVAPVAIIASLPPSFYSAPLLIPFRSLGSAFTTAASLLNEQGGP